MKRGVYTVLLMLSCLAVGSAEVTIEFDGKKWGGDNKDESFEKRVADEGLCILADAKCQVGDFLGDFELEKFHPHAFRFALKGIEGKGAMIDSAQDFKVERESTIMVFCAPENITATYLVSKVNAPMGSETMNADFEGADEFLALIKEGVKTSESSKEKPLAVLIIRSKCSYGLMVKTLQMIRSSGCLNMLIKIDDEIPDPNDIKVLIDPNVRPPTVNHKDFDNRGRIVINVLNDGRYTGNALQVLKSDEAIKDYIAKSKAEFVAAGKRPVMHLRGEANAVIKSSRRVIKIASEEGVNQVVFAVYNESEKKPEVVNPEVKNDDTTVMKEDSKQETTKWLDHLIKPREQDLNMALPANGDAVKILGKPFAIHVNEKGQISYGKDKLPLDQDAEVRDLPLLKSELEKLQADGAALSVSISVDRNCKQQRVIDVLNTLAAVNITTVTFSDLIEEK